MKKLQELLLVLKDRSGATVIEYCIIAGIISVAIVGGASAIGKNANSQFNSVSAGFNAS